MDNKKNFIKGTAILIFANAISKILGAVFKIPLSYILKEEGMAIFNTAMNVYSTVLSFIISGFPLAISRLVAQDYALKNYISLKKTVKVSMLVLSILGIIGSLILFVFADFFAYSMKDPKAVLAIKIISPSVFFVALGNVFKSYYQGCINMVPTAISQIIESISRLICGFTAAYLLKNALIEISSAGAVSGITIGEIIATFILFLLYIPSVRNLKNTGSNCSFNTVCISLSKIAIPMIICSCISSSVSLVDVATLRNALLKIQFTPQSAESFLLKYSSYTTLFDDLKTTLKLSLDGARWLYGAYSGFALTLFHLPIGIIAALGTGVLPLISGAIAKKDYRLIEKTTTSALNVTLIIAFPCSLVLMFFSKELLHLLFSNTSSAFLLKEVAPCLVFICVSQLFTTILHASGKIFEPFLYLMIGMIIKLLSNIYLITIPQINISGTVIGSLLCYLIVMVLNIFSIKKHFKIRFYIKKSIIKPLVSSILMIFVMLLIKSPFMIIFKNEFIYIFMLLFTGVISYILALITLGAINIKEIKELIL